MTQHPHNDTPNTGGANPGTNGRTTTTPTRPARRQRIRGCGVPPTVWFTPHPDAPKPTDDTRVQNPDWALVETIRQFTTPDQNYLVSHLAYPGCQGDNSTRSHHPDDSDIDWEVPDVDRGLYALHVVIPVPSNGDCGGERRWHGTTPGQAYLARLQHHVDYARRDLAEGGIFAVLVPRPRPGAAFADDTGAVIAAARDGGLTYLQHIAVVDAFIDHEGITPTLPGADLDAFYSARAAGLPVHARAHSDLLVFRKPVEDEDLD